MMLPGQIKNYQLNVTKQGMYKASDVEAFRQKVYVAFCEMLSENNALKEKFVSLSDVVNEYNAGKNSIATALIKSQTLADETIKNAQIKADEIISDAERKAKAIYDARIKEADDYAAEKTALADEYMETAKTEMDKVLASIDEKAKVYIDDINKKASDIIKNANEQASEVVSRAYLDAQKAKETCDSILENAALAIPAVRSEVDTFKTDTLKLLSVITETVQKISVPDDIDFVSEEINFVPAETIDVDSIVPFDFDNDTDDSIAFTEPLQENADVAVETTEENADYIFDNFSSFDDIFNSTDV